MPAPPPRPGQVQRSSFVSDDEAELTEFIRRMYAENQTRFTIGDRRARFSARTYDTPAIGADRMRTTIDYDGITEGFNDYVFIAMHAGSIRLTRRGAHSTDTVDTMVSRGDVAFYPLQPGVEFAVRGIDAATLRLAPERVHRVAEDTTGVPAAEVAFHDITPVSASMHRYWRSLMGLVGAALTDPDSPLGSPLLAEDMARTVATAALHTFPNTTMTRAHTTGPGATTPATIRRAIAHIEAHAHLPLQLGDIAAAADTSARALQHGFRRHLDTTPLAHLRRVRLERARRDLQHADPTRGDTVQAIAARWGFANPGRFAAAYRAAYGVLPDQTLRS